MCFGVLVIFLALFLATNARAEVITTLNFSDPIWDVTLEQVGSQGNNLNKSSASGDTITADKDGHFWVRIVVALNTPISTIGYESITLAFDGLATGGLEWNGDLSVPLGPEPASDSDGVLISSSEGVLIDAMGINNTASEIDFDAGSTFPGGNTASFNSADFSFDSSVDNNEITDLTFTLQVNANTEEVSVSHVQLMGILVPEPSSALILLIGSAGLMIFVREKRAQHPS